jgi:hypothetical protein
MDDKKSIANRRKAAYNRWFCNELWALGWFDPNLFFPLSIETKGSFWESKVLVHKV